MGRGEPVVFHNPKKVTSAKSLLRDGPLTKSAIAQQVGVHVNLVYKWLPGGDLDKIRSSNPTAQGAAG